MTPEEEEAARLECDESDRRHKEESTPPVQRTLNEAEQSERFKEAIRELREGS
jgi:hypothetical protein